MKTIVAWVNGFKKISKSLFICMKKGKKFAKKACRFLFIAVYFGEKETLLLRSLSTKFFKPKIIHGISFILQVMLRIISRYTIVKKAGCLVGICTYIHGREVCMLLNLCL